jgi:hypothetical protein
MWTMPGSYELHIVEFRDNVAAVLRGRRARHLIPVCKIPLGDDEGPAQQADSTAPIPNGSSTHAGPSAEPRTGIGFGAGHTCRASAATS